MERWEAIPGESLSSTTRKWTVAQLPELPRKRQISIGESLMNIGTIFFVMTAVVLPSLVNWLQGEGGPVPFLHPNLWNFWLPLFLVIMVLTLIHEIFQLKIGNWTPVLTLTNVILGLISILYIAALVLTQEIINPAFLATLDNGTELAKLREVATWSVDISAAIIVGIYVWDIVNSIRLARQLRQNS
jgi:hypothetical protein